VSNNTVIVTLLDKDYQVACPPGQQDSLRESAEYLNKQMRDIKVKGKVIGLERIAIMAALNIANEFLNNDSPSAESSVNIEENNAQIKSLNVKIEDALHRFRQLEIG
jgi:cell division protein ZapA